LGLYTCIIANVIFLREGNAFQYNNDIG